MTENVFLQCPRRDVSEPSLITQLIPCELCEMRQRDGYHKCPTCLNRTIGVSDRDKHPEYVNPTALLALKT